MKHFTFLLLFATLAQSVCGQVFTKGQNGDVINNGTEITITDFEKQAFTGTVQMDGNLFVKNDTSKDIYVKIKYEIISISNGRMQICFPNSCISQTAVGVYETPGNAGEIGEGKSKNILTEWMPTDEGSCRIKYTIMLYSATGNFLNEGVSVIANYVYSTNNIDNIDTDESSDIIYYDILGKKTEKSASGLKIIRIVDKNGNIITKKVL